MTPHKQRFVHNPAEGSWGDCERTAIACLLDLAPDDVPHWNEGQDGRGPINERSVTIRRAWLAERGLFLVSINLAADSFAEIMEWTALNHPDIHYLVGGSTDRGVNHVVICRNRSMVHDPHTSGDGLTGPSDDGFWWVNFLGKLT